MIFQLKSIIIQIREDVNQSVCDWEGFPFLEIVHIWGHVSFSVIFYLSDLSVSIWEFVFLCSFSHRHSILVFCLACNRFLLLYSIYICIVSWSLHWFTVCNFFIIETSQRPIQIFAPFSPEHWLKILINFI